MVRTRYEDRSYLQPSSQLSNWVFTINNPTYHDIESLYQESNYRAIVFQYETAPTTGTKHIQGYVEFSRSMRAAAVVRILGGRARIYVRLGTQEDAVRYVVKEETREEWTTPVRLGILKEESGDGGTAFENLRSALDSDLPIRTVAVNHFPLMMKYRTSAIWYRNLTPTKRTWKPVVDVFYGEPGSGKTYAASEKYPDAFWLCPPNVRGGPVWFTGYSGQSDVIIDDFYGWMQWTQLLRILDRYPLNVQIHGYSIPFLGKNIVLTSNVHPERWYAYDKSDHMKYEALRRRIDKITKFHKLDA